MSDDRDELRDPDADADAVVDETTGDATDEIEEPVGEADDASGDTDEPVGDAGGDEALEIVEQTPPPPVADGTDATGVDVPAVSDVPPPPSPPASPPPPGPSAPPPAPPPPAPEAAPALVVPLADEHVDSSGWPTVAKVLVGILAVVALAGIVGTVIGFTRASSAEDDADARGTQLDEAIARGDVLERQLDETERDRDELARETNDLIAQRAEILGSLAASESDREAAIAELDAERARFESLLDAANDELEELQDLIAEFPQTVGVDLDLVDIAGSYQFQFTEIGCVALDSCGSPPGSADGTIVTAGGIRLTLPGLLDVPFFVADGTPFGVADSEGLVPPCGADPRPTTLLMTLFDDELSVAVDGEAAVTVLGATIVIDAPEFAECGPARVWYRVSMTPLG